MPENKKRVYNRINPFLDEARLKLIGCYRQLKKQKVLFNPDAIKGLYVADNEVQSTLMALIRYHETSSRILLSKGTMKNYGAIEKYIRKFLQKYRGVDFLVYSSAIRSKYFNFIITITGTGLEAHSDVSFMESM